MESLMLIAFFTLLNVSMKSKNKFRPDPKLKLMDQVRQVFKYHHRNGKRYFSCLKPFG
jgi:hypothetical protein